MAAAEKEEGAPPPPAEQVPPPPAAGAAGAEAAASGMDGGGEACDAAFLEWCRSNGLEASGVRTAFVAEGWRGVVAARPLAPGDAIVVAPERLLMTAGSARRDAVLGPLLRREEHGRLSDSQVGSVGRVRVCVRVCVCVRVRVCVCVRVRERACVLLCTCGVCITRACHARAAGCRVRVE
jgi:hypothetical protein